MLHTPVSSVHRAAAGQSVKLVFTYHTRVQRARSMSPTWRCSSSAMPRATYLGLASYLLGAHHLIISQELIHVKSCKICCLRYKFSLARECDVPTVIMVMFYMEII